MKRSLGFAITGVVALSSIAQLGRYPSGQDGRVVLASTSGPISGASSDPNGDGRADIMAIGSTGTGVCLSSGSSFASKTPWTTRAFYGDIATSFADVNGDGKTDAIEIQSGPGGGYGAVLVRLSNGSVFTFPANWSSSRYYGSIQTSFADVDGDGKADAIAINKDRITIRLSTGSRFGSPRYWTPNPFYGSLGTFFADVDGDGKADAIALTTSGITVRLSNGTTFASGRAWSTNPYYGKRATFFSDVNGDGKADAIVVNGAVTYAGINVRLSSGSSFGRSNVWGPSFYGSRGTFIADVNGDGLADAIAVNDTSTSVRASNGSTFTQGRLWANVPCFGTVGTFLS